MEANCVLPKGMPFNCHIENASLIRHCTWRISLDYTANLPVSSCCTITFQNSRMRRRIRCGLLYRIYHLHILSFQQICISLLFPGDVGGHQVESEGNCIAASPIPYSLLVIRFKGALTIESMFKLMRCNFGHRKLFNRRNTGFWFLPKEYNHSSILPLQMVIRFVRDGSCWHLAIGPIYETDQSKRDDCKAWTFANTNRHRNGISSRSNTTCCLAIWKSK